jgi:hypothetical protein
MRKSKRPNIGEKDGGSGMRSLTVLKFAAVTLAAVGMVAVPAVAKAQGGDTVLKQAEIEKLLPASVYYKGQSATTQLRNSGGVKFADGSYLLTTMVDTSGYSTGIAAKYQAYFINEEPIKIGGQKLAAGIYGIGFIDGDKLVVTDVGAHEVLAVSTGTDAALARPRPLQLVADGAGGYRIYAGRRYVTVSR